MTTRTHRRDLWKKIIKLESDVAGQDATIRRLGGLLEQSDANDKRTIAAFLGGGTGPFCSVPEMMAATARDQITELEAKVERLREALSDVAEMAENNANRRHIYNHCMQALEYEGRK